MTEETSDAKSEGEASTEAGEVGGAANQVSGTTNSPMGTDPTALPVGVEPDEGAIAPGVARLGRPEGSSLGIPFEQLPKQSYAFLVVVTVVSLVLDLASKYWAAHKLDFLGKTVFSGRAHVAGFEKLVARFFLAHNPGGAWGLLHTAKENVRRPFFLLVSAAAIAFIVTLYRRLLPSQKALKWGLPLVLGGALGNVFDRIQSGEVIDFIDVYVVRTDLKESHWPTFNVADIAICVGVLLMAVDMFTAKRPGATKFSHEADPPAPPLPLHEAPPPRELPDEAGEPPKEAKAEVHEDAAST